MPRGVSESIDSPASIISRVKAPRSQLDCMQVVLQTEKADRLRAGGKGSAIQAISTRRERKQLCYSSNYYKLLRTL